MKKTNNVGRWFSMMMICLALTACRTSDPTQTTMESDMIEGTESMETSASAAETQLTTEVPSTTESMLTTEVQSVTEVQPVTEPQPVIEGSVPGWGEPWHVISGDWNEDGQEDVLESYGEDEERGILGIGIRLQISGTENPSVVWAHDMGILEKVVNGDLDGDGEQEIVIVFDYRGSGAAGAYGLMLLDHVEDEWIAVTGDNLFSGFTYQVNYEAATSSYLIQGEESGKEHRLLWDKELEDPAYTSGRVTAFYNCTVVNGTDRDYLELWQYVAGECSVDHVGDMVTTIALQDGVIQLKDEIAVQETLALCKVKAEGDKLEILPVEHVYDGDTKRLEELKNAGWDLEQLYHDDKLCYYEVPYEENKIITELTEDTRYYHWYYSINMNRVDKGEMNFVDQDISKSGLYRVFSEGDQVVCIMWDSRQ